MTPQKNVKNIKSKKIQKKTKTQKNYKNSKNTGLIILNPWILQAILILVSLKPAQTIENNQTHNNNWTFTNFVGRYLPVDISTNESLMDILPLGWKMRKFYPLHKVQS